MRVSLLSILTLGLIGVWSTLGVTSQETPKPVLCYFGAWSVYRWSYGKFDVEDIDPFMCTHVVFGFAGLHPSQYTITSLDPYNDFYENWGKGAYDRFTNLKLINPNLKTLLAIGGWNEGASTYSEMVKTPERRQTFIESCVQMLLDHNFDGLDMDWEYPGGRDDSPGDPIADKDNYSALLRELRAAFNEHNLMLTAAVSAGKNTIDLAYDVPVMSETLDFFNVMTYDYHGWFKNHTYTAHNCPLHQMPEESEENHPGYHLNQEFSMDYYVQLGARKDQLLMGLAAYGRGFTLKNPEENGFYAPAVAGCDPGYYTGTSGFWGFNEYCERMYVKGELDQWKEVRDENVVSPYIVKGSQWFSFEDIQSIEVKAQFIKDNGYAGAMVWSIDTDDFQGFCSEKRFGLIQKVQDVLNGGTQTPPPGYTTPLHVDPTTRPPSGSTPPPNEICDGTPGLKPDPDNCHHYYSCVPENGEWGLIPGDCGDNLAFDPASQACTWPDQVPGCSDGTGTTAPPNNEGTTNGNPVSTTAGSNPDESLCEGTEGFHRDPANCRVYYQCVINTDGHFQVIPGECAEGLFFDMETLSCNWDYLVDCTVKMFGVALEIPKMSGAKSLSLPPSEICHQEGNNPFPEAEGCNTGYFFCELIDEGTEWKIEPRECSTGLFYDTTTSQCLPPELVEGCEAYTTTTTTTTTTPTTTTTTTTTTSTTPTTTTSTTTTTTTTTTFTTTATSTTTPTTTTSTTTTAFTTPTTTSATTTTPTTTPTTPIKTTTTTTTTTSTTTTNTNTTSSTTTTTTTTTAANGMELFCQHEGLNPDIGDPRDCSVYYHCEKQSGHWIVTQCFCQDGLGFDPLIEVCSWIDTIPDCLADLWPSGQRLNLMPRQSDVCIGK